LTGKSGEGRKCAVGIIRRIRSAVGLEAMEACSRDNLAPLDADTVMRQARALVRVCVFFALLRRYCVV
jgi:hypothetical protein